MYLRLSPGSVVLRNAPHALGNSLKAISFIFVKACWKPATMNAVLVVKSNTCSHSLFFVPSRFDFCDFIASYTMVTPTVPSVQMLGPNPLWTLPGVCHCRWPIHRSRACSTPAFGTVSQRRPRMCGWAVPSTTPGRTLSRQLFLDFRDCWSKIYD